VTGNPRSARVARGVVLCLALALPVSARAQAIHHALTVVVLPDSPMSMLVAQPEGGTITVPMAPLAPRWALVP